MKGDSAVPGRNSFELLQELGKGGFATTFRVRVLDPELREEYGAEEVAIKVPLNRQKERVMRRELELNVGLHLRLKDLQSSNIVRYLGFEIFRGQIVMVMEYMKEGSLRDRIGRLGRQKPLPIDEAIRVTEDVLKGLAVVHRERVFHRDIKPENILFQAQTAKIADLGIAKMLDADELARTGIGTPHYMPPEILEASGGSFTSDIWSLSVTLYEMVTGRMPFGDDATALKPLMQAICSAPAPAASSVSRDVPPALSDIIARGLAKDPAARYQTADEMRDALIRFRQMSANQIDQDVDDVRELMRQVGGTGIAERRVKELIASFPNDPRAHQLLGEFQSRCQRYTEAIAAYRRALELAPDSGLLHWNLALAYQGAGQKRNAIASLERAMALDLDSSLRRHASMLHRALSAAG